jgi:hypothetical protein
MSANACIAYYGLRFEVRRDEIEALENRSDPRMLAARKAGLKHYWGNFGAPGDKYLLFIGAQLAKLGPENSSEMTLSSRDLQSTMESTKAKLQAAGLTGDPLLHLQWEPDA